MNTVNFISIPGSIVPEQEVLVFGQNRLTYAELNELVGRIATVFKKLGLKQRDVVAILDTNSHLYVACYYAAAKAGLTFLPLNYRAKEGELEYMINTAESKLLLVGDRYVELVRRIHGQLNNVPCVAIGNVAGSMARLMDLVAQAEPDEE